MPKTVAAESFTQRSGEHRILRAVRGPAARGLLPR